jgi:membrane associated rhomboid family serine protease
MFPIRDENPTLRASMATMLIVTVNVLVWVIVQRVGTDPFLSESVWRFGLIPGELMGRVIPGTRVPAGPDLIAILDGVPNGWSILTSMFMHGGWLHIIANLWFLLIFGDNVEDAMGSVRFTVFYLLCGIAAVLAQVLAHPSSVVPMVGASGAIGGVMGAYMVLYPRAPVHMLVWFGFYIGRVVVPAYVMLGYWFLMQLLSGALSAGSGGVAFWAHVGGFAAGLLLVSVFCDSQRLAIRRERRGRTVRLIRRL